jgi:hypothetical protein
VNSNRRNWRRWLALPATVFLVSACVNAGSPAPNRQVESPLTNLVAVQGDPEGSTFAQAIQLIGVAESVTDQTLTVNGMTVNIAQAVADGQVAVGATVQVQGTQTNRGVVDALYIWVLSAPEAAAPILDANAVPFVIEGPVAAIRGNRVRIHGFDLDVDDDLRLQGVQIGDVLRIYGEVDKDYLNGLLPFDDDIDDDNYVTVRQTRFGFLSNAIYVSDDGLVWRDSGSCLGAPPGWASAGAWRSRCSGEYGGGPPAVSRAGNESSGSRSPANPGISALDRFFLFLPGVTQGPLSDQARAAGGDGSSNSTGNDSSGVSSNESSGSALRQPPPPPPLPPPPPPPPPAGGNGDSNSGSNSRSSSGSSSGSGS